MVAGQTQINISDITGFQTRFNLPPNLPKTLLVPGATDPGLSLDDLEEADLDVEWAPAVARKATIMFVYAADVTQSVQYAIDQDLAPVVSFSYGLCEQELDPSDFATFETWAKQGNAQGITWVSASGDSGAADCADSFNPGLAVDMPASIPEVTAVGGTEFQEGVGQFWNTANDANGASVLSYIPETSWNDTAIDGYPSASGGGASTYFSKPAWQTGPGVPADNKRHVPDVALSTSFDHDGYVTYSAGNISIYGGTSASAQVFAGMLALLNQYLVSTGTQKTAGVGNMNINLYALAQSTPGIFHDITTGNNIVTVPPSQAVGYSAGVGYDSVTGLGSVDVWKLLTGWSGRGITPTPATASLSLLSNLSILGMQDVTFLTATATGDDDATPVGVVQFSAGSTALGAATLVGSAGIATATLAVTGADLPSGSATITASYDGTGTSAAATSSVTVTVQTSGSSSNGTPAVSGLTDGAAFQQQYSPGMILAAFGSALSPAGTAESASSVPLPLAMAGVSATVSGVAAPLYYVSPAQLNIQIPYQTPVNSTATLKINNNGQVASRTFTVGPASPGIFTDQTHTIVPIGNAAPGQTTILFLTGVGDVTPPIATGYAPGLSSPLASLPAPQNTTVSVGGLQASTSFIGIPYGLVGVTQINFQIPSGVPAGQQPVVVNVNGIATSNTLAYVNVTN